jgi:predicted Fe-Mo cluster-binding NifX family protein
MKIAIASTGKDEKSEVSPVTGRSPYFLIFEDKKLVKTIKNPFKFGGGGAGFSVAEMLSEEKVDLVISGRFGPNVVNVLKEKRIKYKELTGISVKEALEKV